jgi:universal stress protein E
MQPFRNILVVVDPSRDQHREVERAMKLADQSQTKLHLVDVVKDAGLTVRLLSRDYAHIHHLIVKEKWENLAKLIEHCRSHGLEADGEVLEGASSQVTLEAARRLEADLVIRAAKGANSREQGNLGASAQKLIRQLPCAIWLTHPEHEPESKTMVATVDASPNDSEHADLNRRILEVACELSNKQRSKLLVCYVWNLYGSDMLRHRLPEKEFHALMDHNRKQHLESFEKLLAEYNLHATGPEARMLEGEPSLAIPDLCHNERADLLVCGTVGRKGIPGLLIGNTAERIISKVKCSILALPPLK